MVGDVNMFLPNGIDEEAECEIMIASKSGHRGALSAAESVSGKEDRRKGFALEALTLLSVFVSTPFYRAVVVHGPPLTGRSLTYAIITLGVKPHNLIAKIGSANTPSIRLFEKLGFKVVKRVEVWDEVELRWRPDEPQARWEARIPEGRIGEYD